MKRAVLIGIITLFVVALSLFWLDKIPKATVNRNLPGEPIKVVTSIPLFKSLTEQIGGDLVLVESIIKGAACSHDYEPSTGDMRQVADSALIIKAGLNFDHWFDKLAKTAGGNTLYIDASRGVKTINEEYHEHEAAEEVEHHHEHTLGNPHYWGNPENVKVAVQNIRDGLAKIRPDQKDVFQANYDRFVMQLDQTTEVLKEKVKVVKNNKIISYSAAFPYFYSYFGFNNIGTVETTCEQEISPKRLMEIAKLMKAENVTAIVGEEVYPDSLNILAKETGAEIILLWPATVESGDYLETLKTNVEKMVSALQ